MLLFETGIFCDFHLDMAKDLQASGTRVLVNTFRQDSGLEGEGLLSCWFSALDDPANLNRFSYTHPSHSVYKDFNKFLQFF